MKTIPALAAAHVLGTMAMPAMAQDAPAKPAAPAESDTPAAPADDGAASDKGKAGEAAMPAPEETPEQAAAREAKLRGEHGG